MFEEKNDKTVFFITIDALRPDHLKPYGYHLNTAPYLDKFIKQGTTFNNAYTNGPATPSSFSAIFTSILPLLNGGYSPLPIKKITFPQLLKEKGIFNYGIHSNPNLGAFFNYKRGFDIFLDGERYKIENERPNKKGMRYQLIYAIKKIFNYKNFSRKLIYRFKGF
ncbi:MAG: sulfatase-like hydrolase/transferase, partial [Promethearchaeota archaeon]